MQRTVIKFGLYSGICAAFLMFLMAYALNHGVPFDNAAYYGYAGMLISLVFVFLGVKAYRDKIQLGNITFGKAFQVGILITLISCLIYSLAWLLVYYTMMPDFMDRYAAYYKAKMEAQGLDAQIIATKTAELLKAKAMYENPLTNVAVTFTEPFPIGLMMTLLSALILRRRQE
ncbi:MAG: DUF4199 family protein [Bacteroidetes bacterium]|nr:DUF4199 family protein [Bacteroidota bacterium]